MKIFKESSKKETYVKLIEEDGEINLVEVDENGNTIWYLLVISENGITLSDCIDSDNIATENYKVKILNKEKETINNEDEVIFTRGDKKYKLVVGGICSECCFKGERCDSIKFDDDNLSSYICGSYCHFKKVKY